MMSRLREIRKSRGLTLAEVAALSAPPTVPTVLITNTLARANADLTIQKTVSGGPASGPLGVFNFTANCGADGNFTAAVTLTSSPVGAIAIRNVPEGASCTVSEDAALPAAPARGKFSTGLRRQVPWRIRPSSHAAFRSRW